uniref:lysR transcriptional regulator n=1 Tax=Thalassionema bacillare TaxID=426664 RepID=UPI001EDEFF49|nr:lysR transcriptional regulator [Thalassionema bacillare]UHY40468.1 lysR transcriptional regulator [Thalassionema bacillare]UHY40855.1 lysR transcriptional regulator [Thalassionema bacillare]UHY41113.1 lysR transcriptional regulator [Thalassionema bacillare]
MLPFTLQQLRILRAIATEKSFTKAANVLFLSQPYLSRQIKALEKTLDVNLVRRNSQIICLTENGEIFLQYTERILALCEESCRALIDLKNGERGNLGVGASQTIGTYLMPRLLALFAQNNPQIKLKVQVNSTRLISKLIVNRQVDLAVVGGQVPKELKQSLDIEPFVEDELNLIISNSNPFAKQKKIKKEDLYHLNFITLHSTSTIRKFVDNILKKNNIEIEQLKIVMQLNSIEAIKTAVSLGLGVAFVSSSAIEKEIKLQTIKILEIENIKITRVLSIISNPNCYKSKAFKLFYKELLILKQNVKKFT